MPPRPRPRRHADDLLVARLLDSHLETLIDSADAVARELDPGQSGACAQFVRDARLAVELAERLDAVLVLPEPLETLDRPILFLLALAAIGIYRAAHRGGARDLVLARRLAAKHLRAAEARTL